MPQPLPQRRRKARLVGVERRGKAASRPHHVADQLGLLRTDRAEPYRIGVAIEHRGYVDEIDRLVVDRAFALLHELFDEMAQAKLLGVDVGHGYAFQSAAQQMAAILPGRGERVQKEACRGISRRDDQEEAAGGGFSRWP